MIGPAQLAMDAPTSITVAITPTTGVNGAMALQGAGAISLRKTPRKIGARNTWNVEITIPTASMGTTVPRTSLQRRGVTKMLPIVVLVVINTLNATSPPAINVHKFEDCPPLTEPMRTMPARMASSALMSFARISASVGIMP